MANQFLVRPARPADYEAVMEINRNVYNGYDYLPVYYHIYLQSPDCHPFVCEMDGKIVAFAALRVIDGGLTCVSVAGRVEPSLNRQGVHRRLLHAAVQEVRKRVPTLQFKVHAGIGAKHFDRTEEAAKSGNAREKIALKWNLLIFKGTPEELQSSKSSLPHLTKDALVLEKDAASEIFADISNIVNLFPTGYLVCYQNWRPLRASYNMLMDVVRSHYTLVSFRENSSSKVKAVSFGYYCKIALGTRLDIYYYDVVPNLGLLKQHVVKHVNHAASITHSDGEVRLVLHFPINHDIPPTKQSLKPFVGNPIAHETFSREYAVLGEAPFGKPIFHFERKAKL